MRHIISDPRGNPVFTSFGSWRSYNGNSVASSRSNTSDYNPRSILFLHVKSSDWNSVIHRAKTHPSEILMVDDNDNTPLHVACQLDPPVNIVISLKEAIAQTNSWGATPLHVAASHRCNAEALKKLIDFSPGSLSRLSRMNRTPIHYACMSYRGLDLIAFRVLLEETLIESRRRKEEQHLHYDREKENSECDSKVSVFIDIIKETNENVKKTEMLDDEEISLLITDNVSRRTMAASPSDSLSTSSSDMGKMNTTDQEQDYSIDNGLYKNNSNIVTWKDTTGKTPLGLLFCRYRERVKRVIEILEQMKSSGTRSPQSHTSLQTDLGHLWGKARLIVVRLSEECNQQQLQQRNKEFQGKRDSDSVDEAHNYCSSLGQQWSLAASWSKERLSCYSRVKEEGSDFSTDNEFVEMKSSDNDGRQFRIVHASVGLTGYGCPPEMIRLAMSIYPYQVREMDEDGNLPLHIAASASSLKSNTSSSNAVSEEDSSVFSDSIVSLFSAMSLNNGEEDSSSASFDKVIRLLLKQYPHAAQTPHGRSGRLPLVLADHAGERTWNDGMKTLLRAYPPALFSGSKGIIPINLYPHVLSLIGGGDPSESPQRSNASATHTMNANPTQSLQRSSGNRFNGRSENSLLHNLLLLKQRRIKELMAVATCTSSSNRNYMIRRQSTRKHSNLQVPSSRKGQASQRGNTRRGKASQTKGQFSCSQSSKYISSSKKDPQRKGRKEYATTMFELLRAKPDLIETTMSHQIFTKS